MIHAVTAVIIMIVLLLLYGTMMLFTDYIKISSYLKGVFLNCIWFLVAEGYSDYDIYYPEIFENRWLNFFIMNVAILLLVFEVSKYIKLRNAFLVSFGTAEHMILAFMIMNFCGGFPGWAASIFYTVSALIVLGIHLSAIYGGKNTSTESFMSRFLAGILLMPSPFMITAGCLMLIDTNKGKVIEAEPFMDFVYRVFDFIKDPEYNYSGELMISGLDFTREIFITSLIVAIVVFVVYLIVDSTVDYRVGLKEKRRTKTEAEKERVRAEISSRIHAQLEKIDSCMAYISTNYKVLKVSDEDMKSLRGLYDEATRIKYSYNGAASGPILKRVTDIKTEIYMIRDRILAGESGNKDTEEEAKAKEPIQNKNEERNPEVGYFNGCTTEDEIKKRYRDLCKVFHPDSDNGDQETFLKIKEDYEALLGGLGTEEAVNEQTT
ncbi:MAG: DnaJ domain-containing protein [Lachnospiraceae bacterium]|nr:DnaJ domain-containing protein [Lachnospiraceae bacterium]